MIIAISGKKQSGKDTVGKIIQYLTAGADRANIGFEQWDGKPVWGDNEGSLEELIEKVKRVLTKENLL